MTPPAIVAAALQAGLALIAVCDHNSARNVAAVQDAAGERLAVIAGMEITSAEEAHVVGLFPTAAAAEAAGAHCAACCRTPTTDYTVVLGRAARSWTPAARSSAPRPKRSAWRPRSSVDDVVGLIHRYGGLALAAHIDRRSFGVIGQLGFFPARGRLRRGGALQPRDRRTPRSCREFAAIGLPLHRRLGRPLPGRHRLRPHAADGRRSRRSPSWPRPCAARTAGASHVHDLSLYLLEMLENSVRAGATVVATSLHRRPRRATCSS